eukprot:CAMPEP_0118918942 /NCGR_PEP_ID=MMETSP1166-20130328/18247_1 /TAXON_ID=1104430 /ORGANISM="Chrysoreinhardia sp, Strain CCMP3193" /LENGTH=306 /DNA_ID=CAMNT_0006859387 /DNA_START=13 /DNA_END=933 /DNA_ORIENTATION=-
MVFWFVWWLASPSRGFVVVPKATSRDYLRPLRGATTVEETLEETLSRVSQALKLEVFDLDDGVFGLTSKVNSCGIEVVKAEVSVKPSLGIELSEMARGNDGRGLVLVSGVTGNAKKAGLRVGDALTFVRCGDVSRRLTAIDYDATMGALREAVASGNGDVALVEANRLVERARVRVDYEYAEAGEVARGSVEALAGENLRKLFLRSNLKLYDPKTKRFDQPYATGDCAGEGICGTCLVDVEDGLDALNPKDPTEALITKGRPLAWRAACRCVVGADNREATVRVKLRPQSNFRDEIDPGVKSVNPA